MWDVRNAKTPPGTRAGGVDGSDFRMRTMPIASEPPISPQLPRFFALIPCAGVGSRAIAAGSPDLPKQYQTVAGQPMVMHTLAAFASVPRIADVLVVVAVGDDFFERHSATCVVSDCGGSSRAASASTSTNSSPPQRATRSPGPLTWRCNSAATRRRHSSPAGCP